MTGRLYADAGGSIYITETDDELVVLAAKSLTGLVRLTVPDANTTRGPPFGALVNPPTEDSQRRNADAAGPGPDRERADPRRPERVAEGGTLDRRDRADAQRHLGQGRHPPVGGRRPRRPRHDGDRRRRHDPHPRRREPRRGRHRRARHAEPGERRRRLRHPPLLRRPPGRAVRPRAARPEDPAHAGLRPHRRRPDHVRPHVPRHLDPRVRQLRRHARAARPPTARTSSSSTTCRRWP